MFMDFFTFSKNHPGSAVVDQLCLECSNVNNLDKICHMAVEDYVICVLHI